MSEVRKWQGVRRAIDTRQAELGLSLAQLVERSGVSDTTLRKMGEGVPLARPAKRAGLCRALQWTTDSIDRLLEGKEPIIVLDEPEPPMSQAEQITELTKAVGELLRIAEVQLRMTKAMMEDRYGQSSSPPSAEGTAQGLPPAAAARRFRGAGQ